MKRALILLSLKRGALVSFFSLDSQKIIESLCNLCFDLDFWNMLITAFLALCKRGMGFTLAAFFKSDWLFRSQKNERFHKISKSAFPTLGRGTVRNLPMFFLCAIAVFDFVQSRVAGFVRSRLIVRSFLSCLFYEGGVFLSAISLKDQCHKICTPIFLLN